MNDDPLRRCDVFRLPTAHPADVSGLLRLIASGAVRAQDIRAIFGKTEGNGCVNDFTRAFALSALQNALCGPLGCSPAEVAQRARAQDRVRKRVGQPVGVGVAERAALEGNFDAAQHEAAAFD